MQASSKPGVDCCGEESTGRTSQEFVVCVRSLPQKKVKSICSFCTFFLPFKKKIFLSSKIYKSIHVGNSWIMVEHSFPTFTKKKWAIWFGYLYNRDFSVFYTSSKNSNKVLQYNFIFWHHHIVRKTVFSPKMGPYFWRS